MLAGSGRVRDDGDGGGGWRKVEVGRRGGSFRPSGDVLALKPPDRELHDRLGIYIYIPKCIRTKMSQGEGISLLWFEKLTLREDRRADLL